MKAARPTVPGKLFSFWLALVSLSAKPIGLTGKSPKLPSASTPGILKKASASSTATGWKQAATVPQRVQAVVDTLQLLNNHHSQLRLIASVIETSQILDKSQNSGHGL